MHILHNLHITTPLALLLSAALAANTSGGDATVTLSSDDGTSSFLVRDSSNNELARIQSDGAVGIGTTTPEVSALLEVKSTSKGLLIPRMTAVQRAAIVSPVEGLLVYQMDETKGFYQYDGTAWSVIQNSPTYVAGLNTDLGGYVFYVTPDGKHGLVAATQDQAAAVNGYTAQDIVSTPSNHNTAGKNFTDWRVPTVYELNLLYVNRVAITGFSETSNYWTSTPSDSVTAVYQSFTTGVTSSFSKENTCAVRAIRSF